MNNVDALVITESKLETKRNFIELIFSVFCSKIPLVFPSYHRLKIEKRIVKLSQKVSKPSVELYMTFNSAHLDYGALFCSAYLVRTKYSF